MADAQHGAGNHTYRNITVNNDARAQFGNINSPVTVTGKLTLSQWWPVNLAESRNLWQVTKRGSLGSTARRQQSFSGHKDGIDPLAESFLTCVHRFELAQQSQMQGSPTKLNNLSGRLQSWGKACGLEDPSRYDGRLATHPRRANIEETLQAIASTISRENQPTRHDTRVSTDLLQRIPFLQRRRPDAAASASNVAKEPRTEFNNFLSDLKQYVEDLEAFTRDLQITEKQRRLLQTGVESTSDVSALAEIENARLSDDDPVSDAASQRLSQLRDEYATRSAAGSSVNHSLGPNSVSHMETDGASTSETYTTALTHCTETGPSPDHAEVQPSADIPQNQRLMKSNPAPFASSSLFDCKL